MPRLPASRIARWRRWWMRCLTWWTAFAYAISSASVVVVVVVVSADAVWVVAASIETAISSAFRRTNPPRRGQDGAHRRDLRVQRARVGAEPRRPVMEPAQSSCPVLGARRLLGVPGCYAAPNGHR